MWFPRRTMFVCDYVFLKCFGSFSLNKKNSIHRPTSDNSTLKIGICELVSKSTQWRFKTFQLSQGLWKASSPLKMSKLFIYNLEFLFFAIFIERFSLSLKFPITNHQSIPDVASDQSWIIQDLGSMIDDSYFLVKK